MKVDMLQNNQDETKNNVHQCLDGLNTLKKDMNDTSLEVQNQIDTLTNADRIIQDDVIGLDNQFSNLEDLSKLSVKETCMELKNYGLTGSREFDLDPDGLNQGQVPIKAWCKIPEGITKIGKPLEIEITHSKSQSRFTHDIDYEPVLMDQIKALMDSSSECYQEITFYCHSTPLINLVRICYFSENNTFG